MASDTISSLYAENPITAPTADTLFEISGDFGSGVVSGAIKLKDLLHAPGPIGDVTPDTVNGTVAYFTGKATALGGLEVASAIVASGRAGVYLLFNASQLEVHSQGAGQGIVFDGGTKIAGDTANTIILSNGSADQMLALGPLTAGYPMFKRSGTALQVRLADDSDFAPLTASIFTGSGSGLTGTPGTLTIDSGWTANADDGDKTIALNSRTGFLGILAWMDLAAGDFGSSRNAIADLLDEVKALRAALRDHLSPNN